MSGSISRIMTKAYKNVLSNPREAKFAFKMQQLFAKSEKRRKKVKEQEGITVPPFLISSIATQHRSAVEEQADCIVPRNIKDYKASTIEVMTPAEFFNKIDSK